MSKSLLGNYPECYVCHTSIGLHRHHVFEGAGRREISEREGCWVYLCGRHHNLSNRGVHFDKELDLRIKRECQRRWMERNEATEDDFRSTFHCGSYLP